MYQWLDIADINNPDILSVTLICKGHLFPSPLKLDGVDLEAL